MSDKRSFPRRRVLLAALLLGAGYLIGAASHDRCVQADVRRDSTAPPHFQSGAQRSEVWLEKIASTLTTIDGRLDRLEKLAAQFATRNEVPHARETD